MNKVQVETQFAKYKKSDPANYRPIANVTFLSKILERIVANQPISYLDANEMIPSYQSGFRRNHSTETLSSSDYCRTSTALWTEAM